MVAMGKALLSDESVIQYCLQLIMIISSNAIHVINIVWELWRDVFFLEIYDLN